MSELLFSMCLEDRGRVERAADWVAAKRAWLCCRTMALEGWRRRGAEQEVWACCCVWTLLEIALVKGDPVFVVVLARECIADQRPLME